jgi:hypothetical protein
METLRGVAFQDQSGGILADCPTGDHALGSIGNLTKRIGMNDRDPRQFARFVAS